MTRRGPSTLGNAISIVAAKELPAAGYSSMPNHARRDQALTPRDKDVYLTLDHIGRGRDGFVCSARTVAETMRCSIATVFRSFRRLVDAGHLRRIRRYKRNADGYLREVSAVCVLVGAPGRAARTKQGGLRAPTPARESAWDAKVRRSSRYRKSAAPSPTHEELPQRLARQRAAIPTAGERGDYATHAMGVRAVLAAKREARIAAVLADDRR